MTDIEDALTTLCMRVEALTSIIEELISELGLFR